MAANQIAETTMMITPIVGRSNPDTRALVANFRIAPMANSTTAPPIPMTTPRQSVLPPDIPRHRLDHASIPKPFGNTMPHVMIRPASDKRQARAEQTPADAPLEESERAE